MVKDAICDDCRVKETVCFGEKLKQNEEGDEGEEWLKKKGENRQDDLMKVPMLSSVVNSAEWGGFGIGLILIIKNEIEETIKSKLE